MTTDTELVDAFKLSMSHLAAGVGIVTSADGDQMHGLVANTPTSVSMEPPTLLVCLHRETRTYAIVERSRRFCVSLLSADQMDALEIFAGMRSDIGDGDRFEHVDHGMSAHGQPFIEGSIAWIDCEVEAIHPGGESHAIVVGRVVEVGNERPDTDPMIWYGRGAGTYQPLPS